jgi:hypothetical protein
VSAGRTGSKIQALHIHLGRHQERPLLESSSSYPLPENSSMRTDSYQTENVTGKKKTRAPKKLSVCRSHSKMALENHKGIEDTYIRPQKLKSRCICPRTKHKFL